MSGAGVSEGESNLARIRDGVGGFVDVDFGDFFEKVQIIGCLNEIGGSGVDPAKGDFVGGGIEGGVGNFERLS